MNRRQQASDVVEDRQTEWADSPTVARENSTVRKWEAADQGTEAHMFAEDVESAVMPYGARDRIRIELTPADKNTEELISRALKREQRSHHRFDETVTDFIREATQTLMTFGLAQYEVVTVRERETKKAVGFRLQWVMPYTIRRRRGRWVQDLGAEVARRRKRERYLRIDRSRIATFEVPAPLSARELFEIKKELAGIGMSLIPDFGLDLTTQPEGYDFTSFIDQRERATAAVTRAIGWNGRGGLSKHITDYYYLVRELRFRRFVVNVRTALVEGLNQILAERLPLFDTTGVIRISGLPASEDLDRLQGEAAAGADLTSLFRRLR